MNRLQYIVDQINESLKGHYFKDIKFHGLCEHEDKDGETTPVFYKGYGDHEFVGFNDNNGLNIYHRLLGISDGKDNELGFGRNSLKTVSYDIKLVAFGNQRKINDSNVNINYKIADELEDLIPEKLSKVQLSNIESQTSTINVITRELDRKTVWEEELPEREINVKPESLLFSINYSIEITFLKGCKTLACETETPLIDLSNISCENLTDDKFGLTEDRLVECGFDCGDPPPDTNTIQGAFVAGQSDLPQFTVTSAQAKTFTSLSNDGGSGTITVLINGGAISLPITLSVGDTIDASRTITTNAGYYQLDG